MKESNNYFQIYDMFHASYAMCTMISYDYVCNDKFCHVKSRLRIWYAMYAMYAMSCLKIAKWSDATSRLSMLYAMLSSSMLCQVQVCYVKLKYVRSRSSMLWYVQDMLCSCYAMIKICHVHVMPWSNYAMIQVMSCHASWLIRSHVKNLSLGKITRLRLNKVRCRTNLPPGGGLFIFQVQVYVSQNCLGPCKP